MAVDVSSMSIDQALSLALKSELESEKVYRRLKKLVKNFVIRDKLDFLIKEEKKHQKVIEGLYQKMFSGEEPSLPKKSIFPRLTLALEEESSVLELLELAMESERLFEDFYDHLSEEVENRAVQEILQYLSRMENGHYSLLKGEYDLCMRDEMYYDREDFQYDMVHIGP